MKSGHFDKHGYSYSTVFDIFGTKCASKFNV